MRFDERAPRAHAERRHEVDDVGHLRELGQLRADFERDLGQALRDERREVLDRLGDDRRAQEPADRRRRDAPVDRTRPPLLRVDVPAGAALEPCPAASVVNLRGSPGR